MSQVLEQPKPNYHKKYKLRNKLFYKKYMQHKKCSKCNSTDSLDNHHVNPDSILRRDKRLGVYYMVRSGYSIRSIIQELKLTIVLCRTCHCGITMEKSSEKDK